MYSKQRMAIDLRGNRIEITESRAESMTGYEGSTDRDSAMAFFDPYGKRLIPEGKGFFRSPWGICYRLVD